MAWTATAHPLKPKSALFEYISAGREYALQFKNTTIPTAYSYYSKSTYFAYTGIRANGPLINYSGSNWGFNYLLNDSGAISDAANTAVLYAELLPLSSLVGENVIKELRFSAESVVNEVHDVEIDINTWYYVNSVSWYINDDNGNYSRFNPRTPLQNTLRYDVFLPYELVSVRYWSNNREFNTTTNTQGAVRFLANMLTTPTYYANDGIRYMPYNQRTADIDITAFGRTFTVMASETATAGTRVTAFPSKEKFTEYCKLWGISVFYDLDSVQYDNAPVDGQPDNPDPEDTPEGTGDNTSDSVHIPSVTAAPIALYNKLWIDEENTVNLRNFLFSETFLNDIRRLWSDPIESVVSLVWYPFNPLHVHNMPILLEDRGATIGNIANISNIQGYPMLLNPTVDTIYIDMGSITIEPYFGRYLDYSGYTDISIYIPYVGEFGLDTNEVMNKTLRLIYYPDILANTFLAILYADNQPIAQYTGSMGVQVPLGGTAYNDYFKEILGSIINTHTNMATTAASGNVGGAALNGVQGVLDVATTQMSVKQVGALTPNSAIFSPQIPYIRISRPYMSRPSAWDTLRGTAAGFSTIVGDCTGYLEVEEIRLVSNDIMTDTEQSEIESILKGGVYI